MNLGMLDLHGRVRAFSDGKLLWDRPNKITTLGRKALLAMMACSSEIEQERDEDWWYGCGSKWMFHPKSWISCFAFGNGGTLANPNTVIPAATSMKDLNLYHIVPLRRLDPEENYDMNTSLSDYVRLPPSSVLKPGRYSERCDYTFSRITNEYDSNPSISKLDPDKYVYFKKITNADLTSKTIYTVANGTIDQSSSRLGAHEFETALCKFRITITAKDIQRLIPDNADETEKNGIIWDSKVNELSLFLANVSEDPVPYHPSTFEPLRVGTEDMPTLPIQFSHITFPTENFFGSSTKDLELEYYVYA
jgi:hypothetical protein